MKKVMALIALLALIGECAAEVATVKRMRSYHGKDGKVWAVPVAACTRGFGSMAAQTSQVDVEFFKVRLTNMSGRWAPKTHAPHPKFDLMCKGK